MQIVSNPSTVVDDFSPKRVWTDEGTLDREFLELLNGKLEEGMRVQEFLQMAGKAFRAEDVKRVFMEDGKSPQKFRFSCPPAFKTLSIIPACLILHPKL